MIVVKVELHSARSGEITELARMNICNAGMSSGSPSVCDYTVETLRGRSTEELNKQVKQRAGTVLGHRRLALHVWVLVCKALIAMGYDKK